MSTELGQKIAMCRKALGMTQTQLAEQLAVSFQAVSNWERNETVPELERLAEIAKALGTTTAELLDDKAKPADGEKLFDVERMFTYIKSFANSRGMSETQRALYFAREKHNGQFRKGCGDAPYITHPLNMACHALAMGIDDDSIIATILLHDVCEDCGVLPEELPANDTVKEAVKLLTFEVQQGQTKAQTKARYFHNIQSNREASIVKLIDRCNNVSFMAYGFSKEKLCEYIAETRTYILPLLEETRKNYPEFYNACYLLKYHICSVINSIDELLTNQRE